MGPGCTQGRGTLPVLTAVPSVVVPAPVWPLLPPTRSSVTA